MREVQLALPQYKRGAGRAHALQCGMPLGKLQDARVRGGKSLRERVLRSVDHYSLVHFAYRFDCQAARLLPALVSAHAVGNDRQAPGALKFLVAVRLPVKERILVVFALAAYIAQAGNFDSGFHIHALDRHDSPRPPHASRHRPTPALREIKPQCAPPLDTRRRKRITAGSAPLAGCPSKKSRACARLVARPGRSDAALLVLVFVDLPAGAVLLAVQLPLLALGQVTVVSGHVGLLLILNVLLASLETRSLPWSQRAVLLAVGDAVLLILLAGVDFVHPRMAGIIHARTGAGSCGLGQRGAGGYQAPRSQD